MGYFISTWPILYAVCYYPAETCLHPQQKVQTLVYLTKILYMQLIIGIPCHMFTCWAFLGIMFQVLYLIEDFQNLISLLKDYKYLYILTYARFL